MVTVPSATVHGIRGQALYLPVVYSFQAPASDVQIIWLFQRPQTTPKYLLGSVNRSVVPDLEYRHKFTMVPPNASLHIQSLHFSDEGTYIVKVNVNMQGNGTVSAHQKILITVDGECLPMGTVAQPVMPNPNAQIPDPDLPGAHKPIPLPLGYWPSLPGCWASKRPSLIQGPPSLCTASWLLRIRHRNAHCVQAPF